MEKIKIKGRNFKIITDDWDLYGHIREYLDNHDIYFKLYVKGNNWFSRWERMYTIGDLDYWK